MSWAIGSLLVVAAVLVAGRLLAPRDKRTGKRKPGIGDSQSFRMCEGEGQYRDSGLPSIELVDDGDDEDAPPPDKRH